MALWDVIDFRGECCYIIYVVYIHIQITLVEISSLKQVKKPYYIPQKRNDSLAFSIQQLSDINTTGKFKQDWLNPGCVLTNNMRR